MSNTLVLLILSFIVSIISIQVSGQHNDVVTCGGFVEAASHLAQIMTTKMDYSSVHVHLYTSEGLLKYTTECTPHGYYFIPIYDKGSFYLKIKGPAGWTFEPKQVPFVVVSDTEHGCSDDINFKFTGFGLSGQVVGAQHEGCSATATGPSGVMLTLHTSDGKEISTVTSQPSGSFSFSNVFPETYTITAKHSSWHVSPNNQTIQMSLGNSNLEQPFTVNGYDVSGTISSVGEAVSGVDIFLYSSNSNAAPLNCAQPTADTTTPTRGGKLLCASRSNAQGQYVFNNIPCGQYTLVPYYKRTDTTYDVAPAQLNLNVEHGNVVVSESFQVLGFSATGRVVDHAGRGIAGVTIQVNQVKKAITDAKGVYRLDQVTTGTYHIKAVQEHIFFRELTNVHLSPSATSVSDITVAKYHLCGRVDSAEGVSDRKVALVTVNQPQSQTLYTVANSQGKFCFEVAAGSYIVRPSLTKSEEAKGILLSPAERQVTISDAPILDVIFTQSRVSISGRVKCLEPPCTSVRVQLEPQGAAASEASHARAVNVEADGTFIFANVFPGSYKVVPVQDWWCWSQSAVDVTVEQAHAENIELVQSGFALRLSSSHDISLSMTSPTGTEKTTSLTKGTHRICLPQAGTHTLKPVSCYRFEEDTYTYDTRHPTVLHLTAVEYRQSGYIVVTLPQEKDQSQVKLPKALQVSITAQHQTNKQKRYDEDTPETIQVSAVQTQDDSRVNTDISALRAKNQVFIFEYSFWAAPAQRYTIAPHVVQDHGSLLFYPRKQEVKMASEIQSCPKAAPIFVGRRGLYLSGEVSPSVAGVSIVVHPIAAKGQGNPTAQVVTDKDGKYAAGPLYDDEQYNLQAVSSGYHFVQPQPGFFRALKLGEVQITVKDQASQPLQGTLLSLSGEGYRKNNATDQQGKYVFVGLFPGQYFLRPLLKEYNFEPKSTTITVEEASTSKVEFIASRVAFSVFGTVRSLNGDPEANVVVEASPVITNQQKPLPTEETTTDNNGDYRLRGLHPESEYIVRVKPTPASTNNNNNNVPRVERASPSEVRIRVKNTDTTGVQFTAFRRLTKFDLTGRITTAREYLDTLEVDLLTPFGSVPLKSIVMSKNLPFFEFNSLNEDRYLIKVRSSLSSRTHTFNLLETSVDLRNHTHIELTFNAATKKVLDQEASQSSFFSLLIGAVLIVAVINVKDIVDFVKKMLQNVNSNNNNNNNGNNNNNNNNNNKTKKK